MFPLVKVLRDIMRYMFKRGIQRRLFRLILVISRSIVQGTIVSQGFATNEGDAKINLFWWEVLP